MAPTAPPTARAGRVAASSGSSGRGCSGCTGAAVATAAGRRVTGGPPRQRRPDGQQDREHDPALPRLPPQGDVPRHLSVNARAEACAEAEVGESATMRIGRVREPSGVCPVTHLMWATGLDSPAPSPRVRVDVDAVSLAYGCCPGGAWPAGFSAGCCVRPPP